MNNENQSLFIIHFSLFIKKSAQDWIRTSTALRPLPPQSSMSTNFITWAEEERD
jgi:hypothetical protein